MRAMVKRSLPVFLPSLAISVCFFGAMAQSANQQSAPVTAPPAQVQGGAKAADKTSQDTPEKTIAQLEAELPILVGSSQKTEFKIR